jgi:ribonuclease HII
MRVGVDEAGKGPVLGPMVAAAVRADPETLPDGIADSKRLSPSRRESLAETLRADARIDVGVAVVPVERIDEPETDMNSLTVAAQARALAAVAAAGDTAIVDAGDVSESRFARRVRDGVAESAANGGAEAAVEVIAEHGADDEYPIVGAASVIAKVERDQRVADLAAEYGDIGSGYPSDPTTRTFLADYVRDHGELPPCARSSWQTAADVLAAAEQSALSEF